MSLTIEHNGRDLRFNEHDESWSCHGMNMHAKSLKALKSKLDKFDSQARRVAVPVLLVGAHGDRAQRADIVMIAKPKDWETDYSGKRDPGGNYTKTPSVWVSITSGNQTERKKFALNRCILPTEENADALARAKEMMGQAQRIKLDAEKLIAEIPRISLDELISSSVAEDDAET